MCPEDGSLRMTDHPTTSHLVHAFASRIMTPITLERLVETLPDAFGSVLPSGAWSTAWLAGDIGDDPLNEPGARACIPIRTGADLEAVLLVGWEHDSPVDALDAEVLGIASDLAARAIRNRRRTDAEREHARAEAAEVRFDLIGMLAHEMRTPLTSIKGYASALLLEDATWDQATTVEFLEAIDQESDRLTDMVTEMLDSTVIESGALELHREPMLLPPVTNRVVELVSRRTGQHRIVTSFGNDFPAIYADPQRVERVLWILLDNAIKYSPDGGMIVVRGRVERGEALVQVSDQGVGIAPEHLNKLFERFFRTEQRRIHGISGTGLGLPIADAIVRAHGGRIWAESVVEEGTTFSFTLPLAEDGVEADHDGT